MKKLIDEVKDLIEATEFMGGSDFGGYDVPSDGSSSDRNSNTMIKRGSTANSVKRNIEYDTQVPGHKIPKVKYVEPNHSVDLNTQPQFKGKPAKAPVPFRYDDATNKVKGHKIPKMKYDKDGK